VIVDFRAVSHDEFVVVYHLTGTARASGVPLDTQTAQVWTVRDGKVWRNVAYIAEHPTPSPVP
jgi:ketosteroid isomerase-like protein